MMDWKVTLGLYVLGLFVFWTALPGCVSKKVAIDEPRRYELTEEQELIFDDLDIEDFPEAGKEDTAERDLLEDEEDE
jgi:hypothetical protein